MSDRTQGQPRIMPDKPGWWWARWAGMNAEMVWSENIDGAHSAWEWLAPIPGPEVCAALARYADALAALDAEPNDRIPTVGIMREFNDAGDALHAAIRAERDAEREGAA